MAQARAHYVKATQKAFPYGWRLVSGPFHTLDEVWDEKYRLEFAGLYPDALLATISHRAKSLPVRRPREAYDWTEAGDRGDAAAQIAHVVDMLGFPASVEGWDGEFDVSVMLAAAYARIEFAGGEFPRLTFTALGDFEYRPAYWKDEPPCSWGDLVVKLQIGLYASLDGTAFRMENT